MGRADAGPEREAEKARVDLNLENVKVLVVDDNRFMREIVKTIFHVFHCKSVEEAGDGADALRVMAKGYLPDLVVTNWNMPGMDGIQFTRHVRTSKESPDPHMPIILMTAYSELNQITGARDSGVNEILVKPISATSLYKRIVSIFTKPRPYVEAGEFTGPDRRRRASAGYGGEERRGKRGTAADRKPAGENEKEGAVAREEA